MRNNNDQDIFEPFDSYGREPEPIYEMANVDPEDHHFGVALTMHILQPGDRMTAHGPRVKFFLHNPERDGFSVTLHPDPGKIYIVDRQREKVATVAEENRIVAQVKKYRIPLWNMYHDTYMSQRAMLLEMRQIDKGEDVPIRGGRYKMEK